jgi:erythrocyte band 7 integral membrane protein
MLNAQGKPIQSNAYGAPQAIAPTAPNLLLTQKRPTGSQGVNNENELYIGCQSCMGSILNIVCFPVCIAGGCNKVIVRQGEAGIMSRMGRFYKALPPGIYQINTCLYNVNVISIKNKVVTDGSQLITSDNMTITCAYYVCFEIADPYTAAVGVDMIGSAIKTIAAGKLKQIVSSSRFQDLLRASQNAGKALKESLENDLQPLGVVVTGAELSSIVMSKELTMSMAQAAIAERDKTAQVRLAQANLEASKFTNEAAAILKENQNSIDLHFFDTLKHIATKWNQTVITADGMLYVPMTARKSTSNLDATSPQRVPATKSPSKSRKN